MFFLKNKSLLFFIVLFFVLQKCNTGPSQSKIKATKTEQSLKFLTTTFGRDILKNVLFPYLAYLRCKKIYQNNMWRSNIPKCLISFPNDNEKLVMMHNNADVTGTWDGDIRMHNIKNSHVVSSFFGATIRNYCINCAAGLHDGRFITGVKYSYYGENGEPDHEQNKLVIWELAPKFEWGVRKEGLYWQYKELNFHTDEVTCCALDSIGKVATSDQKGRIIVWDSKNMTAAPIRFRANQKPNCLIFLRDNRFVAGPDLSIYDPKNPGIGIGSSVDQFSVNKNAITLTLLSDGRLAAGLEDGRICIFNPYLDIKTPELILKGHPNTYVWSGSWFDIPPEAPKITSLVGLSKGKIASGATDRTIKIWNPTKNIDEPEEIIQMPDEVISMIVLNEKIIAGLLNGDVFILDNSSDLQEIFEQNNT